MVTTNWNQAQSGTVVEGQRHFHWNLQSENWTQDPNQNVIMQLSAEVFYTVQGREYSVRLATLVDSTQPTNGVSN